MTKNTYSKVFLTNGLSPKDAIALYKKRRATLLKKLEAPCLLIGTTTGPAHTHTWASLDPYIYQDPTLLYLTGINQKHVALLLNPLHPTQKVTLFVPKKDEKKDFWEGTQLSLPKDPTDKTTQTITGISTLADISTLTQTLRDLTQTTPTLSLFWNTQKNRPLPNDIHTHHLKKIQKQFKNIQILNSAPTVWPLRLHLDSTDLTTLNHAIDIAKIALLTTAKTLKTASTETQVAATLNATIHHHTPHGTSFPSIVASGQNATILHYTKNDDPIAQDDLILLDFGARVFEMHSDISRTLPKSGQFTPLQAGIYTCVLNAQKRVESAVKHGCTIDQLNTICWAQLRADIDAFITAHNGHYTLPYTDRPHNIGHLLGREVHDGDPNREYKNRPLTAGQCITNEPGAYGHFSATINGIHYNQHIGIRIEDNLLITKTGCLNLSHHIPKEIKDIQALFR